MNEKGGYVIGQIVMVVLFLVAAFLIAVYAPGSAKDKLAMSVGYALLVLTFMFGMAILVEIFRGKIDLSALLVETGKGASMSRFQLLIFTFVIALSLFLMVAHDGTKFPDIPPGILTLLGISASTYAVSKGIQAGSSSGQNGGGSGGGQTGGASGDANAGQN